MPKHKIKLIVNPNADMGRFQRLELEAGRRLYIPTDGEISTGFGMDVRCLTVEVLPAGLQVVP